MTCTCGRIKIGMEITENRNWSPECVEHGQESQWYWSVEQVAARKEQTARLLRGYAKVKAAKACKNHIGSDCVCQQEL